MIEGLVRRSSSVLLIAFCVLLFGLGAYRSLPREAAPDVKIPVVMVVTPYIGVSSEDIEVLITKPLETELAGLKSLKKLSSVSTEGVSMVYLEFETDAVIEDALQRVRDRVNRVKPDLPEDVSETEVSEISFADMPILLVTIAGTVDEVILKELGEALKDKVERLPGVLSADLTGGRSRQVRVQINPNRLGHYGLSLNDVIAAVQDENVNIPGGNLAVGDARYLLRVPGEFAEPSEIENIAVKRQGDRTIFVRDIGRVVDDFEDRATYARMNGQTAVSLGVAKRTGANIEGVAGAVKALVIKEAASWPDGTTYQVLGDQSKMVGNMVADLENGIITALILVVGVIMFFMGVRNSLFVAIAIPLSFLLGILTLYLLGITLNMVVLFSLILVLGMLVDNAIVIVENVYRHAEMGKPMQQASIEGTQEVAMAVAASTATTVAVFIPLIFWTGIMGEFMGYMPKTVVIVLIASLVVAIAVLPVLTSRLMKVRPRSVADVHEAAVGHAPPLGAVMRFYSRVLDGAISHRYACFGGGIALLVASFIAYGALNHGTEFFPASEPNRAIIAVTAAEGTDIEATDAIVRKVEGLLAKEENVDVYVAEVGVSGDSQNPMAGGDSSSPNSARITVDFLPDEASARPKDKKRIEKTTITVDRLRKQLEQIAGAEIKIDKESMGPPVGTPVSVEVSGEDFHEVGAYAAKVRRELSTIEGTAKLTDNYHVGRPEMRLRIDREAAKRVGASTRAVAGALRTALAGTETSSLRGADDDVDIIVEVDPRYKEDLQSLLAIRIPGRTDSSPETFPVPLSSIAQYQLAGGSGAIMRIDQKRVVTISGDVVEGANANEVQARIVKWIKDAKVPPGFDVRLGGANDEQKEAQAFLGRAFLIGVFLIAIVLVTQFNRFDLPIIILASVVMSLIGVLWGLIATGTPFGVIMTGIGVISLAGVVVNNAIVLLDYVEQLRTQGLPMREALIQAGVARFRPVMLTAGTTILGLLPMALNLSIDFSKFSISTGSQSTQMWGAMAVAVVSGLAFATVLTLVLVPAMYSIAEDFQKFKSRFKREKPASEVI